MAVAASRDASSAPTSALVGGDQGGAGNDQAERQHQHLRRREAGGVQQPDHLDQGQEDDQADQQGEPRLAEERHDDDQRGEDGSGQDAGGEHRLRLRNDAGGA